MRYSLRQGVVSKIKTFQKAFINISTSVMLLVTSASGAAPLLFAQTAHANPGTSTYTITPCTATSTIKSTSLSGWDTSETRATGHNDINASGLHIWTEGSTSTDKAAGYYPTNFDLSKLGTNNIADTIHYTTNSGLTPPSSQLKVDLNDDGTVDGILVGETIYGNNWWLSNNAAQFAKDGAPHTGGGNGSKWFGTAQEWVNAFPSAKVKAIGYSLGSGVNGDFIITQLTANCVNYTFGLPTPPACTVATNGNFDGDTTGSVNGQNGWSATNPNLDQTIVSNTYGYSSFGCKSLRISNAVTSGSFGDQTFSAPAVAKAGEGVINDHYEASFDIASTLPTLQSGLALSVSPDDGSGNRMSYLRFEDQSDGIHVYFDDVTDAGPLDTTATFNESDISTLSRTTPHNVKFVINFKGGPANDIVKIYIDGRLVKTGTTWEDYYRYDSEQNGNGNVVPDTDRLLFRSAGTAAPANSGNGFLFDNVALATSNNDTAAPTVTVTTPSADGAVVNNSTSIDVKATDNLALKDIVVHLTKPDGHYATYNSCLWKTHSVSGTDATISCPLTGYTDEGTYNLTVAAIDQAGNTMYAHRTFVVDNTAPTATINSKPPISLYNTKNGVHVHAIDANYDRTVFHRADPAYDFTYGSSKGPSFNVAWMGDGDYTMTVYDKAGNSKTYSYKVDGTAPAISKIRINGTTVAGQYKHGANGDPINSLFPVSGNINLTAVIKDGNNGSGVTSAYYIVRKLLDNGYTLSGGGPNGYNSGKIWLKQSSKNLNNWNQKTQFDTSSLPSDGKYAIELETTDTAGNKSIEYVNLLVDNTKPVIKINNNDVTGNPYFKLGQPINAHIIDNNLLDTQITRLNATHDNFWDYHAGHYFGLWWLRDGDYSMTSTDKAGNSTPVTFRVDHTRPVVSGSQTGGTVTGSTIYNPASFTINANDDASNNPHGDKQSGLNVISYSVWKYEPGLGNGPYGNGYHQVSSRSSKSSGSMTYDASGLTNGKYFIEYGAKDKAGNSASGTNKIEFTIDNTAPKITRWTVNGTNYANPYTLVDGQIFNSKDINAQFKDNSELAKVVINNHEIVGKWSNPKSFDAEWYIKHYAAEGPNTIDLYDGAGNTTEYKFVIDSVAPDAPANVGIWQNNNDVTNKSINDPNVVVKWTAPSDNDVAYYVYQAASDNGTYTKSNPWHTTVNGTSRPGKIGGEGAHYYRVQAVDNAGNHGAWSDWASVALDTTAPQLTINPYTGTDTTPTITGTTTNADDTVTVDGNAAAVSSTANTSGTYTWTYTPNTPFNIGETTITVVSSDLAGNQFQDTAVVTVNTLPAPTPQNPNNTTTNVSITPNPAGGHVLGASVTASSASQSSDGQDQTGAKDDTKTGGNVQGDSINLSNSKKNTDANANNSSAWLGLGWWWLLILAVIFGFLALLYRRSSNTETA